MNYRTIPTITFLNNAKRLSKQYSSFKNELESLCVYVLENQYFGRLISNNFYLIRMEISSKKIGKLSGKRANLSIKIINDNIYLLSINDVDFFEEEMNLLLEKVDLD
jgi:hypothetical protein